MKLTCDLCGHILTETDTDHAICEQCGIAYGPERLQKLRAVATAPTFAPIPPAPTPVPPAPPVEPTPAFEPSIPAEPVSPVTERPSTPVTQEQPKQKLGCFTWFLIIMGVLDLLIGTHGVVAVFCAIIVFGMSLFPKK